MLEVPLLWIIWKKNKVKCAYVHISDYVNPHDVVVYSILVDGKEKWFVADSMFEVRLALEKSEIRKKVNGNSNLNIAPSFNFSDEVNKKLKKFWAIYTKDIYGANRQKKLNKFIQLGPNYDLSQDTDVQPSLNNGCLRMDFFDYFYNISDHGNILVYSDDKDKVVFPNVNPKTALFLGNWIREFKLTIPEEGKITIKNYKKSKFLPVEQINIFPKNNIPNNIKIEDMDKNFPARDGMIELCHFSFNNKVIALFRENDII